MSSIPAPVYSEELDSRSIYDRIFWVAYVANIMVVTANALTFRFADMVTYLGGDNTLTGTITCVGTIAGLSSRLLLGQFLDKYGAKIVWFISSMMFIAGALGMAFADEVGLGLYASRAIYSIGLGAMLTCSMVHTQNRVPGHRRTEVIGVLGSSGFIGMISGALLGDLLTRSFADESMRFSVLFGGTAFLGLVYLFLTAYVTHRDTHIEPEYSPPMIPLMVRYWPGMVIFVAMFMGMAYTISTVFLTRFAYTLGFTSIGYYFSSYAISAFFLRLLTTSWIKRMSRRLLIVIGLVAHAVGLMMLPMVTESWHLIFPAISSGLGHALLFPCVVSLSTGHFPIQYRGTANTITMGSVDMGALAFSPLIGLCIDTLGFEAMFAGGSLLCLGMAVAFYLADPALHDAELRSRKTVVVTPKKVAA
jgi:MFS family permease